MTETTENKKELNKKLKIGILLFCILSGLILSIFLVLFLLTNLINIFPKSLENRIGDLLKNSYLVENVDNIKTKKAQNILNEITKESKYDVFVVRKNEINAMALPGNIIIVYEGLYNKVNNDELRFVLGHELGHFVNRDHLKGFVRVLFTGLILNDSNYGITKYILSKLFNLIELSFSRDAEYKADEYSIRLLKERNLSSKGALSFMRYLKTINSEEPFEYFSTHPNTNERIKKLENLE